MLLDTFLILTTSLSPVLNVGHIRFGDVSGILCYGCYVFVTKP